jgi:Ca2+/Na+ antiporter
MVIGQMYPGGHQLDVLWTVNGQAWISHRPFHPTHRGSTSSVRAWRAHTSWIRQGKTPLALANISGAMMIQATVPSGLGLLFTPWRFDTPLLVSGLITMAAISYLLLLLYTHRFTAGRVAWAAAFYLAFAASLIPMLR